MDPKLKEEVKAKFIQFDKDSSGQIDHRELSKALQELKVTASEKDIASLMKDIDTDSDGELNLSEFEQLFSGARLKMVFEEFDVDKSGEISTGELGQAIARLNSIPVDPMMLKRLISMVDTDQSGEVSFEEFKRFFELVPVVSISSMLSKWIDASPPDVGTDIAPAIMPLGVPWYYGVCGGIGGILSRTFTAPLEKIKIVAQTSSRPVSISSELARAYRDQGFRGLFAGNFTNCIRVFPMASIVTYTYLSGLKYTPADNELDPMEPVWRGSVAALAGCVAQACTYPIDVVRAAMTVDSGAGDGKRGVLGTARSIVQKAGVTGLYAGLAPTLCAVGPFVACQMASADAMKSVLSGRGVELNSPVMLCVAGTAGMLAQTVVYPLDVLRRRIQLARTGEGTVASETVIADKTWTALQQTVRREGFRSLFAGIVPTYLKVIPSVGIAMTTTKFLIGHATAAVEAPLKK